MRVSVGDLELYVHEKGEGRPLVALHGGPGLDGSVWFPGLDPLAAEGWRVLAPDHRANGRSDAGDAVALDGAADGGRRRRADRAPRARPASRHRLGFGSFVAQSHMARHGSAAAYVLMGTVGGPESLHTIGDRLATFEPEHLRAQVTASWEREATVETAEDCKRLADDQWPFHVADPEGPLVQWLAENDHVVYRPDVLRHFAAGGDYGLTDLRRSRKLLEAAARPERRPRPHDAGGGCTGTRRCDPGR